MLCFVLFFGKFVELCNRRHNTNLVLEHLYHHKKFLSVWSWSLPWQPPICFLFLYTRLGWTFSINAVIQYVIICIWVLSCSMFLRFIRVVARISSSFCFIVEWNSILWVYHILCIIHQLLDCLQSLATMNNASTYMHIHVCMWTYIFISLG